MRERPEGRTSGIDRRTLLKSAAVGAAPAHPIDKGNVACVSW
jgi:hypothetical protein